MNNSPYMQGFAVPALAEAFQRALTGNLLLRGLLAGLVSRMVFALRRNHRGCQSFGYAIRRCIYSVVAGAVAAVVMAPLAVADQFDTINFTGGAALRYDSNVFRSSDRTPPPQDFSTKGDHITDYRIGMHIAKPYGLQNFQFDVTKTFTSYNTFTYLNFDPVNYRAAWLWALSPRLTGTLSMDRDQAQISFTDTTGRQRNVRTTKNYIFTLDGWVGGGWHLLAGVGQVESQTEVKVLGTPSFDNHYVEGGIRYVAASGNSITFMHRATPTDLTDQPLNPVLLIDTNYRDTVSEIRGIWNPTGNSSFDGTLTYKERTNEHFAQRNFSGTAGVLRYVWTPTGKLQFSLGAIRDIRPYVAFGNVLENSTYRVDNTLSLGSAWKVDDKITLNLRVMRTLSDYRGPVFAPPPSPAREDDFRAAKLGVVWAVARNMSLTADVERSTRSSNITGFDFSDTLAAVGASFSF
jgi:exopolysaccharide biosynthesis operon protein EpsL